MTSMLLAVLLRASILATGADATATADDYTKAHRATMETGKPLVVMVSTDWCAPCQQMKRTVIPQIRKHGLLRRVAFAVVNPDRDEELATKLTGGGPVPQLVMYRRTPLGWRCKKLVGGQSVETVEKFINEGLAAQKADDETPSDEEPAAAGPENTSNAQRSQPSRG